MTEHRTLPLETPEPAVPEYFDDAAAAVERLTGAHSEPGRFVDTQGKVLGTHRGIIHYTIGQRRGLGIGGLGDPLYVVKLDPEARRVIVGPREALLTSALGALLIVLSLGLVRRSLGALWLTMLAMLTGAVISLVQNVEPEQATALIVGVLILMPFRRAFHRRSMLTHAALTPGWVVLLLG